MAIPEIEIEVGQEIEGLSPLEIRELEKRGYRIVKKLGEGTTRNSVLAEYHSGGVEQLRVPKVPKDEPDPDSVIAALNVARDDMDRREIESTNDLNHPNIVTVLDSFRIGDKTVNVEEYFEAQDLESLVQTTGPLREEAFEDIFRQVLNGTVYLKRKGRRHRDLKPSNILVNTDRVAKITDLQNAAKIWDIQDQFFPTRGGTAFTDPTIINGLVQGRPTHATEKNEVYGITGSMYEALTGERPFNYAITWAKGGIPVKIGDDTVTFTLTKDGERRESVEIEQHNREVRKKVRKGPRKYRDMIRRGLEVDVEGNIRDLEILNYEFRRSSGKIGGIMTRRALQSIRPAVITSAAVGVLGLVVGTLINISSDKEVRPTLVDLLRSQRYSEFSLESEDGSLESDWIKTNLRPYMVDAQKRLPGVLENKSRGDPYSQRWIESLTEFGRNVHSMDRRLISAWLHASALTDSEELRAIYEEQFDEQRRGQVLVPWKFILDHDRLTSERYRFAERDEGGYMAWGTMFMKLGLGKAEDVGEVFAGYYCTTQEIRSAMLKTGCTKWYPTVEEIVGEGGTLHEGWLQGLPPRKAALVSRAVALYHLTDEEGTIHWDRIPKRDLHFEMSGIHKYHPPQQSISPRAEGQSAGWRQDRSSAVPQQRGRE